MEQAFEVMICEGCGNRVAKCQCSHGGERAAGAAATLRASRWRKETTYTARGVQAAVEEALKAAEKIGPEAVARRLLLEQRGKRPLDLLLAGDVERFRSSIGIQAPDRRGLRHARPAGGSRGR